MQYRNIAHVPFSVRTSFASAVEFRSRQLGVGGPQISEAGTSRDFVYLSQRFPKDEIGSETNLLAVLCLNKPFQLTLTMHQSYIPTEVLDRVAWMRGGHHKIMVDPARTAHVVVDLQVGFMGEGALLEMPIVRGIVENVNRVSRALRSAGGTIAYAQYKFDLDEPHHWGSHYDRMTPDAVERIRAAFTVGAEQHALWSGLDV